MRIAFLTSADMVPGAADARDDLFELELQWAALQPACAARGIALVLRVWDADDWDVEDHDAVVVGTTWDYQERPGAFLARLDAMAAVRPVRNPPAVVRWNADKGYLRDLAAAGVPTVPTAWVAGVDEAAVAAALDRFGVEEVVAKPVVGACAVRQVRVRRGEALPAAEERPPGAALIQPFLPSVVDEGEVSLVYCGGALSHALRKRPAAGDYRVQSVYGGREEVHVPTAEERAVARAALAAIPAPVSELVTARVDLVRDDEGQPCVIELELIEPYLYPEQGPGLGEAWAAALVTSLRSGCP